ncbi:hypothetical protein [Streptomyces sp. NPDC059928]|uniref:hypothetical protein n=1 Tax=Streptomyces sp. NPDC059928 TaxID=3347007 RepID=UPI0036568327
MTMPGRVKALCVALFILEGLNVMRGARLLFGAAAISAFEIQFWRDSSKASVTVAACLAVPATSSTGYSSAASAPPGQALGRSGR